MPHRGRYIDIGIGVMQRVEAPQERHRVLTAMRGVIQKVEQQKGRDKARPLIADRPGRAKSRQDGLELRPESVRRREDEGGEDDIEEPDADIAEPPPQRRKLPPPSRPAQLRERDEKEAADSDDESYQRRLLARSNAASCRAHAGSAPLSERRARTKDRRNRRREKHLAIGRDRIIRPDRGPKVGSRSVAVVRKGRAQREGNGTLRRRRRRVPRRTRHGGTEGRRGGGESDGIRARRQNARQWWVWRRDRLQRSPKAVKVASIAIGPGDLAEFVG